LIILTSNVKIELMNRTYPELVIRNDPMDRFYRHTILKNCKDKEFKKRPSIANGLFQSTMAFNLKNNKL